MNLFRESATYVRAGYHPFKNFFHAHKILFILRARNKVFRKPQRCYYPRIAGSIGSHTIILISLIACDSTNTSVKNKLTLAPVILLLFIYLLPVMAEEFSAPSGGGVTQLTAGTSITLDPTDGKGNVTINSSASGGGSNQQTNTSAVTFSPAQWTGGGAVYLATTGFVAIPGKVYNMGRDSFTYIGMEGYTVTNSTALDGNITFMLKVSTSGNGVPFTYISSATVIASSNTALSGIYTSGVQPVAGTINAHSFVSVVVSSVATANMPTVR